MSVRMLASQSQSAVLRQSVYNYTIRVLNQMFNVSSGIRQQFVEDAAKMSNIFRFSIFTR